MGKQKSTSEAKARSYRLGLDLGTGSIGWCAIAERGKNRIIDMGVRCFEAGVSGDIESGKDESRAKERREARGPRRNTWRRQNRLRNVFRALQKAKLLPETEGVDFLQRDETIKAIDEKVREELFADATHTETSLLPYRLRAMALDEKLTRFQLGRALYHLAQRRGFQSNLKAAKEEEDHGKVYSGIQELSKGIEEKGARTLGEYFSMIDPEEFRIRGRYTSRSMYQAEFEQIWEAQAEHFGLTKEQHDEIYGMIFDQRPLKSQSHLIGVCELEPSKRHAPIACLEFQRFRMWQRINDLRVTQPDAHERPFTSEERQKLYQALGTVESMSWGGVRKLLGMKKDKEYQRNFVFNFEIGGEKGILGNRTAAKMFGLLGEQWTDLSDAEKHRMIDEILSFESEEPLVGRLVNGWGLKEEVARSVARTLLEQGYGSVSRKAAKILLPLLEKGVPFSTARKELYPESFEKTDPLDALPALRETVVLKHLRNPAVERVLSELRKVVNHVIRRHGKPERIYIELARDLKHGRNRRKQMSETNRTNEKRREDAKKKILEEMKNEKYATPRNILKVRLAEECNWECPFTGKNITMKALVGSSPKFDIEHITPFSRSNDNSFLNKTLCYHEENRNVKRNRMPFEAYGNTDRWDEILGRVRRFQGPLASKKLERFQAEKLPNQEEFTARQLTDTQYASCLAGDYLALLYGGRSDEKGKLRIRVSPGRVTSFLRNEWDLNRLLGHPDNKNRADHRHHAIDALVVALTDASTIGMLNLAAQRAEELGSTRLYADVELPWEGFLDEARRYVDAIKVSRRVSRKLNGALHKATIFSKPVKYLDKDGKAIDVHHLRKKLEKLSAGDVENIVDDRIREIVQRQLKKLGGTPDKAFQDVNDHPYIEASDGRIIPIHKVRVSVGDNPIVVGSEDKKRYVNSGSNHHLEIRRRIDKKGNEKWSGNMVPRLDAVKRKREGLPIIDVKNTKEGEFLFSLSSGEYVMMKPESCEQEDLYRVTDVSQSKNGSVGMEFVLHCDARPITLRKKIGKSARIRGGPDTIRKWDARKVTVDPLGNILPAND